MSRGKGGYIGFNRVPASGAVNSAASGVWTLREAEALRRAGTWPGSFVNPLSISGLQLWLDASDAGSLYDATTGGSLVAADGSVARWEDKSGNARHMTQGTSGSRPARKTAIQGGLDVLRFDGGDSVSMPSSTATFNFVHDGDSTVFVVFKAGTTANPDTVYWMMSNSVSDGSIDEKTGFYLRWDDRTSANADLTDSLIHVVSNNGSARFVGIAKNGFPANTFVLATVRGDIANATTASRSQIRRNGGSAITLLTGDTNAGTALPTANASDNFTIGDQSGSVKGSGLNGDIAEIIMYDTALSDTDRSAVENYLVAKWGITPAPVPQTISGLQLWLDAADAQTLYDATSGGSLVAADGGVARWEDKSGNARHATQATSGSRPMRKDAVQNGRNVLRFDGVNDLLQGSATPGTGDARTVFIVSKYSGIVDADNGELLMIGLVASNSTSRGFLARGGQGSTASAVSSDITTNNINSSSVLTRTAFKVLAYREDSSTRSVAHWQNGTSFATSGTLGAFNNMNAGYLVAARGNAAQANTGFFSGDIAEIIVYNSTLSDTDRAAVESYLMTKWGIT